MLKITEEVIPLIEKALDIKLFPWQKDYLVNGTPFPTICPCLIDAFDKENIRKSCSAHHFDGKRCYAVGRSTGRTLAHCIKLALEDGADYVIQDPRNSINNIRIIATDPIDIRKMERYSDYGDGSIRYARSYYKTMFLEIWHKLKAAGLPVRELIY